MGDFRRERGLRERMWAEAGRDHRVAGGCSREKTGGGERREGLRERKLGES